MTKNIQIINERLKSYGKSLYGDPLFRVVFSDEQTEKRKGTFNEFYGSIFLRTVDEVKEIKKYPWIRGRWILERWAPGELSYHPSLVTFKNGVYICVYVFQDKNGNYLPPLLKVCEIVIRNLTSYKEKTIADDTEVEDKIEEDKIFDELQEIHDQTATERETLSIGTDHPNFKVFDKRRIL